MGHEWSIVTHLNNQCAYLHFPPRVSTYWAQPSQIFAKDGNVGQNSAQDCGFRALAERKLRASQAKDHYKHEQEADEQ